MSKGSLKFEGFICDEIGDRRLARRFVIFMLSWLGLHWSRSQTQRYGSEDTTVWRSERMDT